MGEHALTGEQQDIITAVGTGSNTIVEAFAGTGKTSTLLAVAEAFPRRGIIYLAYNKSAQLAAKEKFAKTTKTSTIHGLAFGALGRTYEHRSARVIGRQPSRVKAAILNVNNPVRVSDDPTKALIPPQQITSLAMQTVSRFAQSGDETLGAQHVPRVNNISERRERDALVGYLLPIATRAWADLVSATGKLTVDPDHWLKMWALTQPRIGGDTLLWTACLFSDSTPQTRIRVTLHEG